MWYIWTSDHFNAHSFMWVKAFKAWTFSVEDDTRPGRPKTSVTKANIAAVKTVVDIATCTGISEGSVQIILKKSVLAWERFALGGYLICSLRSKRHNALNVPGNFWKHTKAVIVGLFLLASRWWNLGAHVWATKQWKRKDKKKKKKSPCITKRTLMLWSQYLPIRLPMYSRHDF